MAIDRDMPPPEIVMHIITGLGDGGAEAVLYRLITGDTENRHHVISLSSRGKYADLLEQAGISVEVLGMQAGRPSPVHLLKLVRMIRKQKPIVVQTWMYHADLIGGIAARLAGHRHIFWGIRQTHLDPDFIKRSTIAVARLNARLSNVIPQRIICCATSARRTHAAMGYAHARLEVIKNGYDFSLFSPDPKAAESLRNTIGVPEGVPLLGNVSRFYPQKDHRTLLAACGQLASKGVDFRLALVGEGLDEQNATLIEWIAAEGLEDRVLLLGKRTDIPTVMSALDIHVLSSRTEAFPNVLSEAMACGTPCVTTDVGDAADIVGAHGWVVPAGNPTKLADAMYQALNQCSADPVAWSDRVSAGREAILSRFSLERMIAGYHRVWEIKT